MSETRALIKSSVQAIKSSSCWVKSLGCVGYFDEENKESDAGNEVVSEES